MSAMRAQVLKKPWRWIERLTALTSSELQVLTSASEVAVGTDEDVAGSTPISWSSALMYSLNRY
jgi:hypothetical protein